MKQKERDEKRRGCYLWQVLGGFPDDQAHGPDTTEAESRQLFTDCRCVDYENRRVRYKLISPFILYDPRLILLRNVLLQEYNVVRKLKISILPTLYEVNRDFQSELYSQ